MKRPTAESQNHINFDDVLHDKYMQIHIYIYILLIIKTLNKTNVQQR